MRGPSRAQAFRTPERTRQEQVVLPTGYDALCPICDAPAALVSWKNAMTHLLTIRGVPDSERVPRVGAHAMGGGRATKNNIPCPGSYGLPA
jgi:hypothetical protein